MRGVTIYPNESPIIGKVDNLENVGGFVRILMRSVRPSCVSVHRSQHTCRARRKPTGPGMVRPSLADAASVKFTWMVLSVTCAEAAGAR